MRRLSSLLILSLALLAVGAAPALALPPVKHVLVVVLENENYADTFGSDSPAPYLAKSLPARGALLPNYYAIGHLSLDNYIAMISGQAPNTTTQADCPAFSELTPGTLSADGQAVGSGCVYPAQIKTVADQLTAAGLSWRGYMEDMAAGPAGEARSCRRPAIGARDTTQAARVGDQYAARHNPFVYFRSLLDAGACKRYDVDYARLAKDLRSPRTTPSFGFVSPNLCNDGHDATCVDGSPGGLPRANAWLRTEIPKILDSPGFRDDGLLIVTFDEAEAAGPNADSSACCGERPGPGSANPGFITAGPGGGRIGAVLISPFIRPGTVLTTPYNHYGLLRSVENLFDLPYLGFARQKGLRAFGSSVFNRVPPLKLRVRAGRLRSSGRVRLALRVNRRALVRVGGSCRGTPRTTSETGRVRLKVRATGHGRCNVTASRKGWRSARVRVTLGGGSGG